jgi:hypothetical protein
MYRGRRGRIDIGTYSEDETTTVWNDGFGGNAVAYGGGNTSTSTYHAPKLN